MSLQHMCDPYEHGRLKQRAERAEAEVERLRKVLLSLPLKLAQEEARRES